MEYVDINRNKWNQWSSNGCIWAVPISHEEYLQCTNDSYQIFLTPNKAVPPKWLRDLNGIKVLALASGGGQQCPFFAANGANVTVFDISEEQLRSERLVAERENYQITIVQGDMTKELPFQEGSFDMVFNPVSNSYIESLNEVWKECYRVLRPHGRLMTGFANPTIYLYDLIGDNVCLKYKMPYNPYAALSKKSAEILFQSDGVQFGHSFEEQFGGIINAGFSIIGFYEDYHPQNNVETKYDTKIGKIAAYLTDYMPIYFAILAEKT